MSKRKGYMRVLHSLIEKIYQTKLPGQPLTVLLCIMHETLRWEEEVLPIKYSDITALSGIEERRVVEAISLLEKKGLIVVSRGKKNGKFLVNAMGLNPIYFGEIIEPTCRKPKMSVIEGGKGKKEEVDLRSTTDQSPLYRRSIPARAQIKMAEEVLSEPLPGCLKNLLKEPLKQNQKSSSPIPIFTGPLKSEIGESFTLLGKKSEAEIIAENKAKYERQRKELGF